MCMKRNHKEMEDPEVAAGPMCSVVVQCKALSLNIKALKLGSVVHPLLDLWTIPFGSLCKHTPVLNGDHAHYSLPSSRVAFSSLRFHSCHTPLIHLFNIYY